METEAQAGAAAVAIPGMSAGPGKAGRIGRANGASPAEAAREAGRARALGLSARAALVLYVAVVASRATSLLFSKLLLAEMGPFTLLGLRFLIAFVLLALLFRKRLVALAQSGRAGLRTLAHGSLLGLAFFLTMACELAALRSVASSTVSFLENTSVVIVPAVSALVARKLPSRRAVAGVAAAGAGVALITLGGQSGSGGAAAAGAPAPATGLALLSALFYSAAILLTARFSRADDPTTLGVLQVGVIGALGAAAALALEQPTLPSGPSSWACLAALVVVCTGFGFTLQPVAQRRMQAGQAGLLCATSPLVAGALGVLVLGEPLGAAKLAGMGLVLAGMLLSARG